MTSVKASIIITTQSKKQYDSDANSSTESDGSQEVTIKSFVKTRRGVPSTIGDQGQNGEFMDTESVGDIFRSNSLKSNVSSRKNLEKKAKLKKAPGGELFTVFRLGPELIYDNVEVTPIPLWPHKSVVESYSTVLQKKSYEIIPISPRKDEGESLQGIEKLFSIKSVVPKGGISWDLDLTMADIEDYDRQPVKKKSSILETSDSLKSSLISQHKEEVYITIPYRTPQRDGSYAYVDHIRVALSETPTEFHVAILSSLVPKGDVQEKQILKRNERYKVVCKLHRESDIYADGETQTFGERERERATQCRAPENKEQVVQVEAHEIYDAFQELGANETRKKIRQEEDALIKASIKEPRKDSIQNRKSSKRKSLIEDSSSSDSDTHGNTDQSKMGSKIDWKKYDADESDEEKEHMEDVSDIELKCSSDEEEFEVATDLDVVLEEKAKNLKNSGSSQKNLPDIRLTVIEMERMISMNVHQEKQADMRGFDIMPNELRDSKLKPHYFNLVTSTQYRPKESKVFGPSLKRFWQFKISFTKGKEVTNLISHPKNGNIIAACYGSSAFDNENIDGLVCIWNAKNIEYPERIYEFKGTSVTCAAFSSLTPYLLAIGLFDGNILVYDIRKESPVAVSSTIGSDDKHMGPVWEVYWMKENELTHKSSGRGKLQEVLISLGNDGVVNRWTAKKGFEPFSILNIRRSHLIVPGRREKRAEALISQHSSAYSICFFPKDYTNYLIGTEEGFIHKCTTAYSEQYINTYIGHTGPVYRIQFSPYDRTIFVSCSGDWTMKIWKDEFTTPLLSMSTGLRTIYDVTCCPSISTVFICASEDHIEVWDISINTLEPIITFKPTISLRKSIFSTQLKSLIIGDVDGGLQFYGLRNFPKQPKSFREKFNQLHEALGEKKSEKKLLENVDSTYYLGQGDSIHIRGQASSITVQEQRSKTLFNGPIQGQISSASMAAVISLGGKPSIN